MERTKWIVLGGGFIAYMVDALELVLLALALPAISRELQLSPTRGGLLASATLIGIGLSSVVTGYVSDNFGRKKALVSALVTFGAFTALLATVDDFWVFLVLRFLAGFGLGGVWSVISSYVVEAFPGSSRGRAGSFVLSSFSIGGALASVLSGLLLPDWRTMFLIAGLGTVIPVLIVVLLFRESGTWAASQASRAESGSLRRVTVRDIFARPVWRRTVIATVVSTLALTGWWASSTWMPSYLAVERGLSADTVAVFMTVLNLGMFVGINAFGWIADRIGRRDAIILSSFGLAATLPLYAVTADQTALLWLGPLFAFFAAFAGLFGSYLSELYPVEVRTTGAGFCFNVGRGLSAFAPFGLAAVATTIGLSGGLLVCAAFFAASGLLTFSLPRNADTAPAVAPAAASATD